MWSKRLADIRPGTVIVYGFILLIAGFMRIVYGSEMPAEWHFLGLEFPHFELLNWTYPVLAAALGMGLNRIFAEEYQLLNSHSYLGYLWIIALICLGNMSLLLLLLPTCLLYMAVLRLQGGFNLRSGYLNIGLLVGLMMLWDIRFVFLLPVTWIMSLSLGRLRWRMIFIGIWGTVTVHIIALTICYITDYVDIYFDYLHWPTVKPLHILESRIPALILFEFWWFYSLGAYIRSLTRSNILKRQYLSVFLIAKCAAVILAALGFWSLDMALSIALPGTLIFIVNELQERKKNWWKDVLLWSFWVAYALLFIRY